VALQNLIRTQKGAVLRRKGLVVIHPELHGHGPSGSGSTKRPAKPLCAAGSIAIKRQQFPWMLFVPKSVPHQAIKNCGKVFERFFNFGKSSCTRPRRGLSILSRHCSCVYL
jgi:hypothetical protein